MPRLQDVFAPMPSHLPTGMVVPPTVDPAMNKNAINPNGDISTIRTIGKNFDGLEVLIPTVSPDGRLLTEDEAVDLFLKTGRHLGKFRSVDAADAFARQLHEQEAQRIGPVQRPMASHRTLADVLGLR